MQMVMSPGSGWVTVSWGYLLSCLILYDWLRSGTPKGWCAATIVAPLRGVTWVSFLVHNCNPLPSNNCNHDHGFARAALRFMISALNTLLSCSAYYWFTF